MLIELIIDMCWEIGNPSLIYDLGCHEVRSYQIRVPPKRVLVNQKRLKSTALIVCREKKDIKAVFQHAFSACVYCCSCVFKKITFVGSNQGYYFENVTACGKHVLKTRVATHLKSKNGAEMLFGREEARSCK